MTDYYQDDLPTTFEDMVRISKKISLTGSDMFKSVQSKKVGSATKPEPHAPEDRFNFVYIVVLFMGLAHFLPVTYFTTANEYWMYKLRNVSLNTTSADERTYLQKNFVSLTTITNSVPSVFMNLISTFFAHKISAKLRILSVMSLHTLVYGSLVVFAGINTDEWQNVFFVITLGSMVLVMSTYQILGGAEYNLITKLPPVYIRGFLIGEGLATIFDGSLRLASIAILPTTIGSAIIYFSCGATLVLLTTLSAAAAMQTKFFRYYTKDYKEEKKEPLRNVGDFWGTLKQVWPIIVLNAIIFLYPTPSIYNLVVSEHYGDNGTTWGNKYFVTVCTFWIPAFVDVFGRIVYNRLNWDWPVAFLLIFTLGFQTTFFSLIVLSNARPRNHLPVVFSKDWQYGTIMTLYAFIRGFSANMTAIKSISLVPPNRTEFAMLILYLSGNIFMLAFSPLGLLAVQLL